MENLYDEAFVIASGQYLTKNLPDNYGDMTEGDLHDFIEKHVWEGVENLPTGEVISQIAQTADVILEFNRVHQE